MLTVEQLITILKELPPSTTVRTSYDTCCGGTEFDEYCGAILYSKDKNSVDFACESLTTIEYLILDDDYPIDSEIIFTNIE